MYRFPSAAREQKKNRLCTSRQTAGNHANTARGASSPAKPVENMPLPLTTSSAFLPANVGHSARCITSKTSRTHATATVDDEHGYFLIGHVCRETTRIRPQEPSPPNHAENQKFSPKPPWMKQNMYPQSNQPLRLSKNWTTPKTTAAAETPQFSARPTRAPVIAQQQARPQPSKNCTCESPRSAAQCALCVPRSACSWNVEPKARRTRRTAGSAAA